MKFLKQKWGNHKKKNPTQNEPSLLFLILLFQEQNLLLIYKTKTKYN